MAVPESKNSNTANAQYNVIFCDQLFECLNTPNIQSTPKSRDIAARMYANNDDGARGKIHQITFIIGKCNNHPTK